MARLSETASADVKSALHDPAWVCKALGILGRHQRQARGVLICCPWHQEKTPSCSVRVVNGTIAVKCHGCGVGGDVLSLIGAARGFDMKTQFREILEEGASIANMSIESMPQSQPPMAPEPAREYPPQGEIEEFCNGCVRVTKDPDVSAWLRSRNIDPNYTEGAEIALALPAKRTVPRWASYRGVSWAETGHRLSVPMFDATGAMRSVRAGRVVDGDSPKRLPPGGYRASGLVMACPIAVAMLRGTFRPRGVAIFEGEPDFIGGCVVSRGENVGRFGITSGAWTQEIADRIPDGLPVSIRTDRDEAGERYFIAIAKTLKRRCEITRGGTRAHGNEES